jgi:hypothetical protein
MEEHILAVAESANILNLLHNSGWLLRCPVAGEHIFKLLAMVIAPASIDMDVYRGLQISESQSRSIDDK